MVDIAKEELGEDYNDEDIKNIQEKLDLEMKTRWRLLKNTRREYFEIVQKILRKEYVLRI